VNDLFKMDEPEDAATNARRMQRLWDEEVKNIYCTTMFTHNIMTTVNGGLLIRT
jgi:hypothetical protein